jgi:hypothetical protein
MQMRVIDKAEPNNAEKFWIQAGKMSVRAMLADRSLSDFVIEETAPILEAAQALPKEIRDNWFQSGVSAELSYALKAEAVRLFKNPNSPSIVGAALARYLNHLVRKNSLFSFEITARAVEPKKATRKIVTHDEKGRIKSFLEVEESVVV